MQSLPVAFGVDTYADHHPIPTTPCNRPPLTFCCLWGRAKWICVGSIDATQLGVALYLYAIGTQQPPPRP